MSDRTMQADLSDDALISMIERWSAQVGLPDLVGHADAAFLVLDAEGSRVLHASRAAVPFRDGLVRAGGVVSPGLNLTGQIGGAVRVGERPRLARLRLDPKGIAPAATCLVARVPLGEATHVLILAPVGATPAVRSPSIGPDRSEPSPPPAGPATVEGRSEPAPVASRRDGRLVWRSDGAGVLRHVSGDEAVVRALTGRSWSDLFARRALAGDGLAAAIAGRATFRALAAVLVAAGDAEVIELDLSGAPIARPPQLFAGFSGFGLIRARRSIEPEPAAEDRRAQASAQVSSLSANEHAAFREIARSLGVRFAGDDAPPAETPPGSGASSEPPAGPRGSVTPFPVPSRAGSAAPGVAEILGVLPVGVLIRRGGTVLFANPCFLALTGHADLTALREAGDAAGLSSGSPPVERGGGFSSTVGAMAGLLLDRAEITWEGAAAELLLARPTPATGRTREPAVPGIPQDGIPQDGIPHDGMRRDDVREDGEAARVAELRDVLDSLPDGVLTLDEAGRVLSLNAAAAALLGREAGEVVGRDFPRLLPEKAVAAVEALIEAAGRSGTGGADVVAFDGEGAPVPLSLYVARLPGGGRFCVTVRDRSEVAAGEAKILRQAEAAAVRRADFLAKVSHEIRTPLNGILGFADTMLGEPYGSLGNERYREHLRDIHAAGSHALRVVDDLLDLTRIEAGRVDLSFTDIPLNELVSGCIALMQPQAARDRIVVRTSFAPDLKTLQADERSMRQAALNVIANAIRFTEAGGQVIVSTMIAERGEIALRVRDTGVGMTSEEVEDALHPFRRAGATESGPGGGTGLGLTLTKALVEANRGRFRITSRKHEGTLVEMVFPAAEARRA